MNTVWRSCFGRWRRGTGRLRRLLLKGMMMTDDDTDGIGRLHSLVWRRDDGRRDRNGITRRKNKRSRRSWLRSQGMRRHQVTSMIQTIVCLVLVNQDFLRMIIRRRGSQSKVPIRSGRKEGCRRRRRDSTTTSTFDISQDDSPQSVSDFSAEITGFNQMINGLSNNVLDILQRNHTAWMTS